MGCISLPASVLDPDSSPKSLHLFSKNRKGEKKEVKGDVQDSFSLFPLHLEPSASFCLAPGLRPCGRLMHLVAFAAAVTQANSLYLQLGKLLQPATHC